jgi:hypothetical protein
MPAAARSTPHPHSPTTNQISRALTTTARIGCACWSSTGASGSDWPTSPQPTRCRVGRLQLRFVAIQLGRRGASRRAQRPDDCVGQVPERLAQRLLDHAVARQVPEQVLETKCDLSNGPHHFRAVDLHRWALFAV